MNEDKIILNNIVSPDSCLYQVSTLQALMLGYIKGVISVKELLKHGDTGLGTFEDLDGEMIVIDGHCYRASSNGQMYEPDLDYGIPFAVATKLKGVRSWDWDEINGIDTLTAMLNNKIEAHFGLNSMHIVRIDGDFDFIDARSELPSRKAQHVSLKELLNTTQYSFRFEKISGSVICLYFPDYMDGLNLPGWHLHFISKDRSMGGHVFDLKINSCRVKLDKIARIELQLPTEPGFDTYELKSASAQDAKNIEQGKK